MKDKPAEEQAKLTQQHSQTNLVSYFAIGLSLMALLVSVIEVSFLREEVRAQAWPYLQISSSYSERGYALFIENKGVGPAKVVVMNILLDDTIVKDLDKAIRDTVGADNAFSYDLYKATNPAPGVMSADERIAVFSVPWQPNTRILSSEWSERINISACYCSIFEDCWLAQLDQGEPEKVEACSP